MIETELGAPLFDRTTRKVRLNAFGSAFLPYANKILDIENEYTAVLANQLKDISSKITIASIPVMSHYHINDILAAFQQAMPNLHLEIMEADTSEQIEMLKNRECDFAFLRETDQSSYSFPTIPFDTDHIVAVLPSSHPLASNSFLTLDQLKEENFFFLSKQTMMHKLCVYACEQAGFTPNVTFTSHRAANIIDLVRKGMGVALLTKKPSLPLVGTNIALVDVVPYINTSICLAYPDHKKLSPAARQFLNFVQDTTLRS